MRWHLWVPAEIILSLGKKKVGNKIELERDYLNSIDDNNLPFSK